MKNVRKIITLLVNLRISDQLDIFLPELFYSSSSKLTTQIYF